MLNLRCIRNLVLSTLPVATCFCAKSSAETHVLMVRHGQTNWNREPRYQGHTDVPLNEKGVEQSLQLAEKIAQNYPKINAIYSSDLTRAFVTALATAEKFALPVIKKTGLRELNLGEVEGLRLDNPKVLAVQEAANQRSALYPDFRKQWDFPFSAGGESYNQLLDRVKNEILEIAKTHPNETVVVFTHGGVIQRVICDALNVEKCSPIDNCSIAHLSVDLKNQERPISFLQIEALESQQKLY
jgi:broad specificity phosphatase PhoE